MKGGMNFDDILKEAYIDTYFQPIVNLLNGNVIGYEALSRGPKGTEFHMPMSLIAEAKRRNRMNELDILLRKMALINASKHNLLKPLFINIDPISIYEGGKDSDIVRRSGDYGIPSHRVVVEVSEKSAICSVDRFQKIIDGYKKDGFQIACDDVTGNITNIKTISCISPKYIKISGDMVRNINLNRDVDKLTEINTVIQIGKMINAKIIAVGVENFSELETLYHMGIDAAQGNFLGEPNKEIKGISKDGTNAVTALNNDAV